MSILSKLNGLKKVGVEVETVEVAPVVLTDADYDIQREWQRVEAEIALALDDAREVDVHVSALVAGMAKAIQLTDLVTVLESVVISKAFVVAYPNIGNTYKYAKQAEISTQQVLPLKLQDDHYFPEAAGKHTFTLDEDTVNRVLEAAGFVDDDEATDKYLKLAKIELIDKPAPIKVEEGLIPISKLGKRQKAQAPRELLDTLASVQFTVDQGTVALARKVREAGKKLGRKFDDEYVLKGCMKMDQSEAYYSPFNFDGRGRFYQSNLHGPAGAGGDLARASYRPVGVTKDYRGQIDKIISRVEVELEDFSGKGGSFENYMEAALNDEVNFTLNMVVPKPYQFVKAAKLLVKLRNVAKGGPLPYLNVMAGKDAKCSGHQLLGLMTGDKDALKATGFGKGRVKKDSYKVAELALNGKGFNSVDRPSSKVVFMATLYGQGWAALTKPWSFKPADRVNTWKAIHGAQTPVAPNNANPALEKNAKLFHKTVQESFGSKVNWLMDAFKMQQFTKDTEEVDYLSPDGFIVDMAYKISVDIHGDGVAFDTLYPEDVTISTGGIKTTLKGYTTATEEIDLDRTASAGGVNFVHSVDGLLARLICKHLGLLGVKNIAPIHDCFEVNLTQIDELDEAIKSAYLDIFGSQVWERTEGLPHGNDPVGLYFAATNPKQITEQLHRHDSGFKPSGQRLNTQVSDDWSIVEAIEAIDAENEEDATFFFAAG